MSNLYWDKIRILVTNRCNYTCPFCHNEGQDKNEPSSNMTLPSLELLIDYIGDQGLSEICFSGGEPFINSDIIAMIKYAENNTKCDISCASNFSLISERQIESLKASRVKFNIQFPFANSIDFQKSSGHGKYEEILENIKKANSAGIKIGLNSVIQNNNIPKLKELILFAIENELPLKLLPQIGLKDSVLFKNTVYPILQEHSIDYSDKGTGATRWTIKIGTHTSTVLYIDSPCFTRDIATCKKYGEIRIHPNIAIQPCIQKGPIATLQLDKGKEYVIEQFRESWRSLNHC